MIKNVRALLLALGCTALLGAKAHSEVSLEEVAAYAEVSVEDLQQAVGKAVKQQIIIDTMTRPYEGKPWWQYRKLFITTSRINEGVKFYFNHDADLKRVEQIYGVPPEVVCAIIGVETFYGRNMGTWKVLDALYTLGFHYPPREAYFSKEFGQFVKLAKQESWDLTAVKGSYAGAMGMGQFMPTSYLNYAVDFDGDGHIDLFNSPSDAIGSVANYFKEHGFQGGYGIYYPAKASGDVSALQSKEWELTARELYQGGVSTKVNLDPDEKVRLFSYELEDGSRDLGVGLNNFYAIMRYNKSPLYARAVYELAEFIRHEHHQVLLKQGIVLNPQGRRP